MNLYIKSLLINELNSISFPESLGHRAVGDRLEADAINIIRKKFDGFQEAKSLRSIDDFSIITSSEKCLYDVKTHYLQDKKGFSMPNLISIKYLKDILEDNTKTLSYIFIDYSREGDKLSVKDVDVKYVWELDWSMLRIGSLGKGQLQIKDANKEPIFTDIGREEWLNVLKSKAVQYYNDRIATIQNRYLVDWI